MLILRQNVIDRSYVLKCDEAEASRLVVPIHHDYAVVDCSKLGKVVHQLGLCGRRRDPANEDFPTKKANAKVKYIFSEDGSKVGWTEISGEVRMFAL